MLRIRAIVVGEAEGGYLWVYYGRVYRRFFMSKYHSKVSVTQVWDMVHKAAPKCEQEVVHGGIRGPTTSTIYSLLLDNWQRRKVIISARRASSSGVAWNIGRRWITSATLQLRRDEGRQRKTSSSTAHIKQHWRKPHFQKDFALLCSFLLFVREPLGYADLFVHLPHQGVNTADCSGSGQRKSVRRGKKASKDAKQAMHLSIATFIV